MNPRTYARTIATLLVATSWTSISLAQSDGDDAAAPEPSVVEDGGTGLDDASANPPTVDAGYLDASDVVTRDDPSCLCRATGPTDGGGISSGSALLVVASAIASFFARRMGVRGRPRA